MSTPYTNRIHEKRAALGLSQRALAKATGTSQQQIQRIEAGVQAVRIDLAARIAGALNSSLAEVFPKIQKELNSKKGRSRKFAQPPLSRELLAEAGIEADPRQWTLRIGFEDGREVDYWVSAAEKERVSSIIWDATFDFFAFDTDTKRVAANRSKINYAHFLFDLGVIRKEQEEESYKVVVNFVGTKESVVYGVEPDDADSEEDGEGFRSQLQNLFFDMDGRDADDDEIVWFDDEDGERVYLRTKQILFMEVPLLCCEPALWRSYLDNLDDSEEAAEQTTQAVNSDIAEGKTT